MGLVAVLIISIPFTQIAARAREWIIEDICLSLWGFYEFVVDLSEEFSHLEYKALLSLTNL